MVANLTSIHKDVGSIPGLAQWVKGSGIAMSFGVGLRCGWDPSLPWLAALAPVQPLAWERPYAPGMALKRQTDRKKEEKEGQIKIMFSNQCFCIFPFLLLETALAASAWNEKLSSSPRRVMPGLRPGLRDASYTSHSHDGHTVLTGAFLSETALPSQPHTCPVTLSHRNPHSRVYLSKWHSFTHDNLELH